MIGISMLDSLTDEELVKVATEKMSIRVPEKMSSIPTTVIMSNDDPSLVKPMEDMDNDKVVTMCRMEIVSRYGWLYLGQLLENDKTESNI